MLKDVGTSDCCEIVLGNLPDGTLAQYSPTKRQIQIRQDLVQKGEIVFANQGRILSLVPIVDMIYQAMHEVRHAEQHYYFEHPDLIKDDKMRFVINYNHIFNPDVNAVYFNLSRCQDEYSLSMAMCLYMLQPIERDAFEFAQKATNDFCKQMQKLFPNDPDFEFDYQTDPIDMYKQEAEMLFDSDDPIDDMKNIILTINGYYVEKPLNEIMCDVIRCTQNPIIYECLCVYQERNLEISERIARGEQPAVNEAVDDSQDFAENEGRGGYDDIDDPFQDISDRR